MPFKRVVVAGIENGVYDTISNIATDTGGRTVTFKNSRIYDAGWVGWQDSTPPVSQIQLVIELLVMMRISIFVFMILRELVRYLANSTGSYDYIQLLKGKIVKVRQKFF